ncbi:UDP-N-acetylglucosamine 2-epimerase (non-hydrolyzing) [Candidatus Dojkabacteria bacterium CG_4_9_14_3_um_filter_150_Dojkabacteria_WS6_41_13]|uniref:UDP-N-acetylglucosamine 2-epimerase (non-hydrolyzing) n=1 Tax=Candidatus Dojkabacteria bacterium CG_4_10_14_0_2_um_filter_Dojkabacteria_WS6_41_15 TaxID=2014249 RepID=A0A2M7W3G8_9BACT|nr:MAG: UDP-N-acetylglucosamine 2-epimerase (non-hydrolyzing) [Candidatus Dojkabacteria bacterium CG_4_10_14_0_2_um_filter_Dojkabacteria_WS6_41_15]PJB22563.1 MAG: UDP-N-acetylglucosamine 2-epimerase (non-hydrolyzing) [Candidatus Dojkabacteria bacterium CG_4_9_14_3_um_filter_150_Dojkabacteria_WS6_41_13]
MKKKKILFVFGTRPEAIKLAPLFLALKKDTKNFTVKVCATSQHREMQDQILQLFSIKPDYDLNIMIPNQTLFYLTSELIKRIEPILDDFTPDLLVVQGDTTTVFAASLAGFYKKIAVAHVEAGLRSGDMLSPFPEEANRVLASKLVTYHFCPTTRAVDNLKKEGITTHVYHVQNTVIDALFWVLQRVENEGAKFAKKLGVDVSRRNVLITAHRRESFGKPFEHICAAVKTLAVAFPDTDFVYPVHPNPNVRNTVYAMLQHLPNVKLIEPLDYPEMVWMMNQSTIVLTDSGGVQEEAPSLGKPVLVLRDVTERQEGIDAGNAILVGTNTKKIIEAATLLLTDKAAYAKMGHATNPYGDGKASERIAAILKNL